jgi:hypothetical protein
MCSSEPSGELTTPGMHGVTFTGRGASVAVGVGRGERLVMRSRSRLPRSPRLMGRSHHRRRQVVDQNMGLAALNTRMPDKETTKNRADTTYRARNGQEINPSVPDLSKLSRALLGAHINCLWLSYKSIKHQCNRQMLSNRIQTLKQPLFQPAYRLFLIPLHKVRSRTNLGISAG